MKIFQPPSVYHHVLNLSVAILLSLQKTDALESIGALGSDRATGPSYFFYQPSEYPRDCREVQEQCSSINSSGVYVIKPDGYPEPFDVYCDMLADSGGWTVIYRRQEAERSIDFNREWNNYKIGFGFLSNEFWLGNEKLSYFTNQKKYELLVQMTKSDGSSVNVTYNNFRISDKFSDYKLVSLMKNSNIRELFVTRCPSNMAYGNCTGIGNACIPQEQCGCFITGADRGRGLVLPEGRVYVSPNCDRTCSCTAGQLNCDNYQCSPQAVCQTRDNIRQCYCNVDYTGDGVQCTARISTDCQELYDNGERNSGVYKIRPTNWVGEPFDAYCNMTHNGGWTVFQRRKDGSQDFYLDWINYTRGFGSPDGELWLGNEKLHHMTNQRDYQLRIDLVSRDGGHYYAQYNLFKISSENDKFKLVGLGTFSGNAGYDRMSYSRNRPFSTRDRDNDDWSLYDCAERHRGAWWFGNHYRCQVYYSASYCNNYCPNYNNHCDCFPDGSDNCANCAASHLNGEYDGSTRGTSISWEDLGAYECSIRYTQMKIRPVGI